MSILPKGHIQPEGASYSQTQPMKDGLSCFLPPASDIPLKQEVGRTFPGASCRSAVCPSQGWAGLGADPVKR